MSQYRAYFVPGGMDPWGLQDRESDMPASEFWSYDPVKERDTMSYDEYLDWFRDRHPKMDDSKREKNKWAEVLAKGCIGITMCNLHVDKESDLIKQCYATKAEADQAFANLKCVRKRMYSIHLWTGHGGDKRDPDDYRLEKRKGNGTLKLQDWLKGTNPKTNFADPDGRPSGNWNNNRGEGVNYDFGWVTDDGNILHANQGHNPEGKRFPKFPRATMSVFKSTLEDWQGKNFYGDFDTEAWCVKCQPKKAECVKPKE